MQSDRLPRKLAAILYADVAGYSRLTGEDEDATHRTLSEYLDLISETIAARGGEVVHYAGDAVLADFSSVLEALSPATQIQRKIAACNQALPDSRKVEFRIGVNLGDVIVDRDDIYGDGVNVAARLETLAEAGGICVSEAVRNAVGNRLPVAFEDLGEQSVKNIPEPVHAYRVALDGEQRGRGAGGRRHWEWRLWQMLVVASAAFAMVAAAAIVLWVLLGPSGPAELARAPGEAPERPAAIEPPPSTKPSLAVLPFDNLSGDAEQDYFSDGITEDLITDLSQISGLFVIARNSVFTYKGSPVKVQQVAEDLGVRYVLEGSVRKAGNRVRINAQLVDATTGHHLWAERFDREMTDIFAVQDDITRHIVSALAVELAPGEKQRRTSDETSVPEAYDTLLRGLERLRRFTPENNAAARALFEKAAALDPTYARAYADIAFTHAMDATFGWTPSPERSLELGLEAAREALALDDSLPQVHFALSSLYNRMGRHEEAIAVAKRSVELEPGYADGHAQLGFALIWAGRPQEALEAIETAMRYDPRAPFFYRFVRGHALFAMNRFEEAIASFERVIERNADFLLGHLYLAAAYGHTGRIEDAEWERLEAQRLQPELTITAERERRPYEREDDLQRYVEGLRLAGFPE